MFNAFTTKGIHEGKYLIWNSSLFTQIACACKTQWCERAPKRGNDLKRWIQNESESYHSTTLATWINQVGSERAFVSSISRNEFWTSREPNTKSNNLLHGRDQLPPLPTHIHQLPLYPNPQGNVAPTFAKFTKCIQTSIQNALQKRTLNLKTIRFKCELPYQKNSGRLQKDV